MRSTLLSAEDYVTLEALRRMGEKEDADDLAELRGTAHRDSKDNETIHAERGNSPVDERTDLPDTVAGKMYKGMQKRGLGHAMKGLGQSYSDIDFDAYGIGRAE